MENTFIITGISRVIFIGKEEYPDAATNFPTYLPHNELIYHYVADSTVYFGGKVLPVQNDTVRFLPKGEGHEYRVERNSPSECIDICFDTDVPISAEAFVMPGITDRRIPELFRKLFLTWVSRQTGYRMACMGMLYQIISLLQRSTSLPAVGAGDIEPALREIERRFLTEDISVEQLAADCGMTHSRLKYLFHRRFGVPPKQYIIRLKLNHACDLLRGGYSVTKTAELCGYNDMNFFSRQFKSVMGLTPSAFSRRYLSSK